MKKNWFCVSRIIFYFLIFLYFALLDVATVLNADLICPLSRDLGLLCPTCGFTRGFTLFMHFRFSDAFLYNPVLTVFIVPVFLMVAVQDIASILYRTFSKKDTTSFLEYILIAVFS